MGETMRRPRVRFATTVSVALALAALGAALASPASADLRPGSARHFMTAKGALREPLPRLLATPRLSRAANGRLALTVRAGYRVSNWGAGAKNSHGAPRAGAKQGRGAPRAGAKRAHRDRALVFVTVARRLLGNGPSPLSRVDERVIVDRRLRHRHAKRRYRVLLSPRASRFLLKRGALSGKRAKRRRALALITIRIEQDRDFKRVDGRYDWREGVAFSPLDRVAPREPAAASPRPPAATTRAAPSASPTTPPPASTANRAARSGTATSPRPAACRGRSTTRPSPAPWRSPAPPRSASSRGSTAPTPKASTTSVPKATPGPTPPANRSRTWHPGSAKCRRRRA